MAVPLAVGSCHNVLCPLHWDKTGSLFPNINKEHNPSYEKKITNP
jgi:hypothetical protein